MVLAIPPVGSAPPVGSTYALLGANPSVERNRGHVALIPRETWLLATVLAYNCPMNLGPAQQSTSYT